MGCMDDDEFEEDVAVWCYILIGTVVLGWLICIFVGLGTTNETEFYVLEERGEYKHVPVVNEDGNVLVPTDECFNAPRTLILIDFMLLMMGELMFLAAGLVAGVMTTCLCVPCLLCCCYIRGWEEEEFNDNVVSVWACQAVLLFVGGFFALGAYVLYYTDPCLTQSPAGSIGFPTGFATAIFHLCFLLPPLGWICCNCCSGICEVSSSSNSNDNQVHPFGVESTSTSTIRAVSGPYNPELISNNGNGMVVVSRQGSFLVDKPTTPKQRSEDSLVDAKPAFEDHVEMLPVYDPITGTFTMDTYSSASTSFAPPPSANDDIKPPKDNSQGGGFL